MTAYAGLVKVAQEYAPGIPDKNVYGDPLNTLKPGDIVDFVRQRHETRRNPSRPHDDLRLGTDKTNLFSWAVPRARMPEAGEQELAVQTQLHSYPYGKFQGTIGRGYGAGHVTIADSGKAIIGRVTPNVVHFTLGHTKTPMRYALIHTKGKDGTAWRLLGVPNSREKITGLGTKAVIKPIKAVDLDDALNQAQLVQAKIDGASMLLNLDDKGELDAFSVRPSATGAPIRHTERLGLFGRRTPAVRDSTFRGEAYYTDAKGKAIPFKDISGILNSNLIKAIETQRKHKYSPRLALFDVLRYKGKPVESLSAAEKRKIIDDFRASLPEEDQSIIGVPDTATGRDKTKLVDAIRKGKHPQTTEGVVLTMPDGTKLKAKNKEETTGYITGTYTGTGKRKSTAGGLTFVTDDKSDVPVESRVGTGFTDQELQEIVRNIKSYIGKPIRIEHQGQFASGKLRAPSYKGLEMNKLSAATPLPVLIAKRTHDVPALRRFQLASAASRVAKRKERIDLLKQLFAKSKQEYYGFDDPNRRHMTDWVDKTSSNEGHIGVDLDGTLAKYDGWKGIEHIGKPIPRMVANVKRWLNDGKDVRIFTARAASGKKAVKAVKEWCAEHIGRRLPVTNVKDPQMTAIYDDRAKQVERNTGKIASAIPTAKDVAVAAKKTDTAPTDAQKESGRYRKGTVTIRGLEIAIENPKGSVRSGVSSDGTKWSNTMHAHYGFFRKVAGDSAPKGKDGDQVDCFIGPEPKSYLVFVIDQVNPKTRKFDETKVILGCKTSKEAEKLYLSCYSKEWKGLGAITPMLFPQFKRWLQTGDTKKPVSKQVKSASAIMPISAVAAGLFGDHVARERNRRAVLDYNDIRGTIPSSNLFNRARTPKDTKVLRTASQAERYIAKSKTEKHLADVIRSHLTRSDVGSRFIGKEDGTALIIEGKGAPASEFNHEVGHARSFKRRMAEGKPYTSRTVLSKLTAPIVGSTHTPMYKIEREAWDLAGVPESDKLRQAALRTYETSLDQPTYVIGGAAGGAGIGYLLERLRPMLKRAAVTPSSLLPKSNVAARKTRDLVARLFKATRRPAKSFTRELLGDSLTDSLNKGSKQVANYIRKNPAAIVPVAVTSAIPGPGSGLIGLAGYEGVKRLSKSIANKVEKLQQPSSSLASTVIKYKQPLIEKKSSFDSVPLKIVGQDGTIRGTVTVEVADTFEKRAVGLSNRDTIPHDSGMFFDRAGVYWMKDVNEPLDLLFLNKEGHVLEIHTMPVDPELKNYYRPSSKEAEHALELAGGWCKQHGVEVGDQVFTG